MTDFFFFSFFFCFIIIYLFIYLFISFLYSFVFLQKIRLVISFKLCPVGTTGFKGSTFLKNRHFIIQEMLDKLIYGFNTIIKYGTWQPVKFQLVSCSCNERIFLWYLWINVANISELMLPTELLVCFFLFFFFFLYTSGKQKRKY